MKILFKSSFVKAMDDILDYIAKDSINRAIKFNEDLHKQFKKIPDMPYKCRKSIYYENKNIRDLVFKGYTITYFIDKNSIVILGILKYKKYF